MKNIFFLFLLLGSFVVGCNKKVNDLSGPLNDTLYTYKNIVRIHMQNPELALAFTDTAEMKHIVSADTCLLLRTIIYDSMRNFEESERLATHYLETTKTDKHDPFYIWMLQGLCNDYMADGKYELSLKCCLEGIKLAHETNDSFSEASFSYNAGCNMVKLGNGRGYEYMDAAIELLEQRDVEKDLPTLSFFVGQKSRMLANDGRNKDAADVCGARLKIIDRMKGLNHVPDGYLDEQRGRTLSVMAYCLAKAGLAKEADEAAKAFYTTAYSQTPSGCDDIQYYELEMKHGQRLIEICNRLHPLFLKSDTINLQYEAHLDNLAKGYRLLGNLAEAYAFMIRKDVLKDSIFNRERASKAQELSEQFHSKEKEIALLKEQEHLKMSRLISFVLVVVLVLVSISLWVIYRYYQVMKRKNRILVKRVNELLDCQKEIRQIKHTHSDSNHSDPNDQSGTLEGLSDITPFNNSSKTRPMSADSDHAQNELKCNLGLSALFDKLENLMHDQQLYKDTSMSRETIMQLLNINRNQLAQMMNENANGVSISSYINDYRVRNACEMIRQNPDVSMQVVCSECGFSSVRTFNRLFKLQLSMTPLEYKAAL